MYYVPGFTNYLNSIGERPVYSDPTAEVPIVNVLDPAYQAMYAEPDYSTPTSQPVYAEPVYTPPPPPPPPVYTPPTPQPVYSEPVYSEPVYTPPTAQPVYSEPVYSEPTTRGILSDPAFAERFSAMAPMQPEPSVPEVDLGGWNLGMVSTAPLNILSDPGPAYDPNMLFRFDTGSKIGTPDGQGGWTYQNAAPLVFQPGQQYVMVNPLNGNVIGRASTPEEMQKLVDLSSSNKDWQLYRANEQGGYTPGTQLFDRSNAGSLGSMLVNMGALALPAVGGAVLGPVLSGALGSSAAVGAGLGAAVGSAASGVTAGKSIGDILKGAALTGLSTFGMAQLLNSLGIKPPAGGNSAAFRNDLISLGVDPSTASGIATNLTGALAGALPSDIVVAGNLGGLGSSALAPATGALTSGALAALGQGSNLAETAKQPQKQPLQEQFADASQGLTVFGDRGAALVSNALPGALSGTLAGALNAAQLSGTNYGDRVFEQQPDTAIPETQGTGWDVVASQIKPPPVPPLTELASIGSIAGPALTTPPEISFPRTEMPVEQTVPETTGTGWEVLAPEIPPPPLTELASIGSIAGPALTTPPEISLPRTEMPQPEPGMSIKDIADYMNLAGLGIGALGSLFGGSGQQGARLPAGFGRGALNQTFTAQLPTANLPGLTSGTGGPRTAADLGSQGLRSMQDYYRYGYGPEQSFFGYVPQGAPNTSQAYTGYAEGGYAVSGEGDGREDKIPALLSDGEYVMDAETVALLGNGSNKAGADMLDQFRVNVRKHKGRDLARGEFSKNAKRPDQYMAGGRT